MIDRFPASGLPADLRIAFDPVTADTTNVVNVDWIESPVGPLLAGATRDALVLLEFSERAILEEQLETVRRRFDATIVPGRNRWLDALRTQLGEYFAGRRRDFDLPLAYPGTAFQEKVWSALLRIPYGETRSYIDLACAIGDAKASRAVGTANGMNRIAIVIPCHRVINANGELGGYGGGLWRKRILLDLERGQGQLTMG
ncbi:MAG TPA: methylated-DNA--[protein]-cysteine S-methyltransferase [Povalibacter sp.]|uniref:methylated-DNA--[protein]-cysteine S-methyltransferase n=1 Tax=Povalibacter sp. TaxID=1962978 RepID=UPI002B7D1578|nr:methylated-DNA--[protein]-cysteine S-methyltransferase [Povalibacter sp.]HMN46920.1 methylated-DNA--[protein]-cysteine S-methyltransferase [Povalibacter sp.]